MTETDGGSNEPQHNSATSDGAPPSPGRRLLLKRLAAGAALAVPTAALAQCLPQVANNAFGQFLGTLMTDQWNRITTAPTPTATSMPTPTATPQPTVTVRILTADFTCGENDFITTQFTGSQPTEGFTFWVFARTAGNLIYYPSAEPEFLMGPKAYKAFVFTGPSSRYDVHVAIIDRTDYTMLGNTLMTENMVAGCLATERDGHME